MGSVRLIWKFAGVVRAYSAGGHGGAGTWGGARCTSLPQAGIGQPFRLQRGGETAALVPGVFRLPAGRQGFDSGQVMQDSVDKQT